MESHSHEAVFFDLDNTLFDHEHALHCAISAMQDECEDLAEYSRKELCARYNHSLEQVYERYLNKEITFEETHLEKMRHFCSALGFEEPDSKTIKEFRAIYKAAYRANRRATPGSIELLSRLREHGYRIAIITNGKIMEQTKNAKAIGVYHLVDRIITSEEAGCAKPDIGIFKYAMNQMRIPPGYGYMVGDNFEKDIRPALDAELHAVWYLPHSSHTRYSLSGIQHPVIRHMGDLSNLLGLSPPASFGPEFDSTETHLGISDLGIDIVTEPRYGFDASGERVHLLVELMGYALMAISAGQYPSAMSFLEAILLFTFEAVGPGPKEFKVSYPRRKRPAVVFAPPQCHVGKGKHSILVELKTLSLYYCKDTILMGEVAILLQSSLNNLMRENPRKALRQILTAMANVAEDGGFYGDFFVTGAEFLDEDE